MIGRRSVCFAVLVAGCGAAPGPTGGGFASLATGLQGVAALAWDPVRAELVVAEADGDRLLRWTPQGAEAFQERAQRPLALAFDDDGRLLVIEGRSRSLVRYDRSGERSVLATGFAARRFEAPVALAAGPDREVWVLDGGERAGLYRLAWDSPAPDAKRVVTRVPARFETPRAVAFAGSPPQVVVCAGPDSVDILRARWAAAGELEELRRGVRIEGLQITASGRWA